MMMKLASNYAFCIVWAIAIGISVPLGQMATADLNEFRTDYKGSFGAIYVTQGCVLVGGLLLLVLAQFDGGAFCWPKQTWALFGGFASLSAFSCVVAVPVLGSALILMIQLCGLIVTSLAIDIYDRRINVQDWQKHCCVTCVVAGAGLRAWDMMTTDPVMMSAQLHEYLYALGVFASGCGYAIGAKCNMALRQEFRSSARATAVWAVAHCFGACFIDIYIYLVYGFTPFRSFFELERLPLWLAGGAQCAFVIGSMAFLPQVLGYTTSNVGAQLGKFVAAAALDSLGFFGPRVPITIARALTMILVCIGASGDALVSQRTPPAKEHDHRDCLAAHERLSVRGQSYGSVIADEKLQGA